MLRAHYRINRAAGVSINLQGNGQVAINACSVIVKDNKLDIDKKVMGIAGTDELKSHFPPKTPVSFNLFGKGVLQKQVAKLDEINPTTFAQILPNGNPEDFYIQNFVSGENSFVSVVRKAEADKWIDTIKELGFVPLVLSLGPFPVQNVLEQLNSYDGDVVFDGHLVKRNNAGEWVSYNYQETLSAVFPLKIASEVIDERLLLPYAAAFQLALSPDIQPIHANVGGLEKHLNGFLANKRLKVNGFVALCVFFALLLINFFAFSWLSSDNGRLAEQISISARSMSDIEGITQQVETKEKLLKTLGWDEGLNKALLIDQLASLLPGEIRLLDVAVNPVDVATTRIQKTISFSDRHIRLVGSSENILPVNEWIARIKTSKWVKTIELNSYAFNSELGQGQFTITITY